VTLGAGTTLNAGAGNISFADTVNGNFALTANSMGTTTFGGAVGGGAALATLTTNAGGTTAINGGAISTMGAQTYNDAVTLGAGTTLTSTGSGNVTLASTVNGAQTLVVNTAGTTTFGGVVGGTTALTSVTTDAAGTTAINGGLVKTTGSQTYGDAVSGNNVTLTSTGGGAIAATNVSNDFTGTVTIVGGTVQLTDANALTVELTSGETILIANAAGGTGNLTMGGNTGDLRAISNGGVLEWTDLSAASANLNSNRAAATGGKLVVTGELVLMAGNLTGALTSIEAQSAILDIASLEPPNSVTIVLDSNLRLLVGQGVFRFKEGSQFPGGVRTLNPDQVRVCIGNVCTATIAERSAIPAAQSSALTSASVEARQSFGTDSVTEQINMGFSGDVGIAPTMGHSVPLEGEIINTPKCVPEAKAGVECKE
jgi:hypothetical protein